MKTLQPQERRGSRIEMNNFTYLCIGPPEIGMGNVLHPAELPEMCLTTRIEYLVVLENLSQTDKRSKMECFCF